jgi:hypothetical protein
MQEWLGLHGPRGIDLVCASLGPKFAFCLFVCLLVGWLVGWLAGWLAEVSNAPYDRFTKLAVYFNVF